MAHPLQHAQSSARKFGGTAKDYLPIHNWFDETKAFLSDFRHRALRHHAEGIFLAEQLFGIAIVNSEGTQVPVRYVGEQHVREDLGRSARLAVTNPSSTLDVRSASGRRNVNKQGGPFMNAANGHVRENGGPTTGPPAALEIATAPLHSAERVKELVAALEVPFDPSQIEWRVMNTTKNQQPVRGQVVPYADQRAYTDRLNALFTPAGWTRKYTIHTSASFERSKDQKIVAKVLVTCELTIFGLGSHSATGEEWADDDNACTSAEAQAFKRACSCLGLGRYLYYFTGTWVDLDDRKRPKTVPHLAGWATPAGWLQGLRPSCAGDRKATERTAAGNGGSGQHNGGGASAHRNSILHEIEQMEHVVGKRMYRGLLKTVARVWNPKDIQDLTIKQKVLAHLQAAERGLRRAEAARAKAGLAALAGVLGSLRLGSLGQVDNLKTLLEIVVALEEAAPGARE
jgi:hypothetical protein